MEHIKLKTGEELDAQLGRVESFLDNRIKPETTRAAILSLSLDELKEKYPREYATYSSILRTEAKLLSFPDLPDTEHQKPKISMLQAGERGVCFKIDFEESSHVIKPAESTIEKNIADKASRLGIGPKQFQTKDGYIHEEFIQGTPLLSLEADICTPSFMEDLGVKFMQSLNTLHQNNILVNDQLLANDFGKSHIIIDNESKVRFVDFGASVDLSNFPNLTDEEVLSLMRTDPFMAFRLNVLDPSQKKEIQNEIRGYRENILSNIETKEGLVQMKDYQLLSEGLGFLNRQLPNVSSFIAGIKKGLN